MKRIIDGVTYNTDTSTRLAKSGYEALYNNEPYECVGTLYQTRGGAFFIDEAIDLGHDEDGEREIRNRFKALSAKGAEEWLMTGDVEIIHNPFSDPPEAEAEAEPGSTIYIRVPSALKRQVEEAAKEANLSVNSYALRCLENTIRDEHEWTIDKMSKIASNRRKVETPEHVNLSEVARATAAAFKKSR